MDKNYTKQVYTIFFMRGDVYNISAYSSSDAYKLCRVHNPETASWDVLKIVNEKGYEC